MRAERPWGQGLRGSRVARRVWPSLDPAGYSLTPAPTLCAAQLVSAKGSYDQMPPNALLCAYLDDRARREFVDSSSEVKVKRGEVIMRQGACSLWRKAACAAAGRLRPTSAPETETRGAGADRLCRTCADARPPTAPGDKGNNFYLIKGGTCEVAVAEEDGSTSHKHLGPGGSCGELSLLTGNSRSATVTVRAMAGAWSALWKLQWRRRGCVGLHERTLRRAVAKPMGLPQRTRLGVADPAFAPLPPQATSDELVLLMVNRRLFMSAIGDKIKEKRITWMPFLETVRQRSLELLILLAHPLRLHRTPKYIRGRSNTRSLRNSRGHKRSG